MNREEIIAKIKNEYDIIVIGGGATGAWCAIEAQLRGYKTLLLEKDNFAEHTSSRSTKLIHGGLRYLKNFDFSLIREALTEREILLNNAPDFVKLIPFVVPIHSVFERIYYKIGLFLYDLLAFNTSSKKHRWITKKQLASKLPNLEKQFKGGYIYYDGQFDDTIFANTLIKTFVKLGGDALNYFEMTKFIVENKKLVGVSALDKKSQTIHRIKSNFVINATGPFTDLVRRKDNPQRKRKLNPSKGVHLLIDQKFLSSSFSLLVPKTPDGRVIFAIPWKDKLLIGTTDTYTFHSIREPKVLDEEIDYLLDTLSPYLIQKPSRQDIISTYAGIRPLIGQTKKTKKISRKHQIEISNSNLISIMGGKWTIGRLMGEDTINTIEKRFHLPKTTSSSKDLEIKQ